MRQANSVQTNNNNYKQWQNERSLTGGNKHTQFILKQQEKLNGFQFSKLEKEIERMVEQIIEQKLKERNTILLAKLAKQNILQADQNQSTYHHTVSQLEDPLIYKSLDEINQFYCSQISSRLIRKVVQFLKAHKHSAKIMATGIIIQNNKCGFNLGGMCFWNNISDGQKTIKKKIPPLKPYQPLKVPLDSKQHTKNDSFDRQGLLIVTIYMCKFQKRFRNN